MTGKCFVCGHETSNRLSYDYSIRKGSYISSVLMKDLCYNCYMSGIGMEIRKREVSTEAWRNSRFFDLSKEDREFINERGLDRIGEDCMVILERNIKPAVNDMVVSDGLQTPYRGHPVFKIQHKLGLCCRKCIEGSYGIDVNITLDDDTVNIMHEAIMKELWKE